MNKYNLKVGQEVYLSASYGRNGVKTIEKIGRKYFYLKGRNQKFYLDTLEEADYIGRPDTVYLTKKDYDNRQKHAELSLFLNRYRFEKLSLEDLIKIAEITGGIK